MNNYFVEGPIRTGKSTILRKCLADYKGMLGGFSSQRIRKKNTGDILGFSLMPASDFCIELFLDDDEMAAKENVFISHNRAAAGQSVQTGFRFSPEVFAGAGVKYLSDHEYCDLMLLDEIGGVELMVPTFKEKLYEVLESPVPCIGVLKGIPNAASFKNKKVLAENSLLREFLTKDSNSEIISL